MSLFSNLKIGKAKPEKVVSTHKSLDAMIADLEIENKKKEEELNKQIDELDSIFAKHGDDSNDDFASEFDRLVDAKREENSNKSL